MKRYAIFLPLIVALVGMAQQAPTPESRKGLSEQQLNALSTGILQANQFESSPGAGDGIQRALAQCATLSHACNIQVPAQYTRSEALAWGNGNLMQAAPIHVFGPKKTDPFGCITDMRWGPPQVICHQGLPNDANGNSAGADARFLGSAALFAQNITNAGNGNSPHPPSALALQSTVFTGARDIWGDETQVESLTSTILSHTPDITASVLAKINAYSPGDTIPLFTSAWGVGSGLDQNEGMEWRARFAENGSVYSGSLRAIHCDVTCTVSVTAGAQSEPDSSGAGLALIDLSRGYNAGYISSIRKGTITGSGTGWDSTFGVTTAITTTTAVVDNASAGEHHKINTFPQSNVTISVANSAGFRAGQIACMFDRVDPSWECAHITQVPNGSSIVVDQVNYHLAAGSTIAAGGLTGYGFGMDADWVVPIDFNGRTMPIDKNGFSLPTDLNGFSILIDNRPRNIIRQVYPIVSNGPGDVLTLFTSDGVNSRFNSRSYATMGGAGGAASITVQNGVVTSCTATGGSGYTNPVAFPAHLKIYSTPAPTTMPSIHITSVTPSGALNGCAVANGGAGVSSSATVTVETENPYHIYPQARTLDVYNAETGAVDGSAIKTTPAVGEGNYAFQSGDMVEQPHYFRMKIAGLNMATANYQSGGQHSNLSIGTVGQFGNNDYEGRFANSNDPTLYASYPAGAEPWLSGHGQLTTPHGLALVGPHRNGVIMMMPPYGGDGNNKMAGLFIQCGSPTQCNSWNTTIPVLGVANVNLNAWASDVWGYNPVTQSWSATAGAKGANGVNPSCTYSFAPNGFSYSGSGCGKSSSSSIPGASVPSANLAGTTGSIGGALLSAGRCASGTTLVSGATSSMAVVATPQAYPGDGIFWNGYVSRSGEVTVKVCATVTAMPTASAYNVRVLP